MLTMLSDLVRVTFQLSHLRLLIEMNGSVSQVV